MDANNEFVVVLPSNTNVENSPAEFLTTLSQPIYLEPTEWSVGLVEINFKNTIKTIHKDSIKVTQKVDCTRKVKSVWTPKYEYTLGDIDKNSKLLKTLAITKAESEHVIFSDTTNSKVGVISSQPCTIKLSNDYGNEPVVEIINRTDDILHVKIKKELADVLGFEINNVPANDDYLKITVGKADTVISKKPIQFIIHEKTKEKYLPVSIKDTKTMQMSADASLPPIEINYEPCSKIKDICNISPKPGTYTTPNDIINEINKNLVGFKFSFNPRVNRIILQALDLNAGYTLHFINGLNDVLGFSKTLYHDKIENQQAEMEIDLLRGINSIFIYCDLCEPIRVGDTIAPLLRNIAFNSTRYGEMINVRYTNPIYIPVCKSFIDTIRIDMRDASGKSIPFVEGLTTCLLHFKRL